MLALQTYQTTRSDPQMAQVHARWGGVEGGGGAGTCLCKSTNNNNRLSNNNGSMLAHTLDVYSVWGAESVRVLFRILESANTKVDKGRYQRRINTN